MKGLLIKDFKLLKGQKKLLYDYYCYIYNNDNSISGDFVSDWFLRFCGGIILIEFN